MNRRTNCQNYEQSECPYVLIRFPTINCITSLQYFWHIMEKTTKSHATLVYDSNKNNSEKNKNQISIDTN